MTRTLYALGAIVLLPWAVACGRLQDSRAASSLELTPTASDFRAAIPAALTAPSLPSTPLACGEFGCPSLAAALQTVFATNETAAITMLERIDSRLAELAARTVDHYVPCLEGGSTRARALGGKLTLAQEFHCSADYTVVVAGNTLTDYEQLLFSRSDVTPLDAALRQGVADDKAVSIWTRREAGRLDAYHATSRTLDNAGRSYLQVRIGPGKALAFTAAGIHQFNGDSHLSCGVQARSDGERIYVRGRFHSLSSLNFINDPAACAALSAQTFCVSAIDFATLDVTQCAAAGLTTLELTELTPSDLLGDEWGSAVNFDHASSVKRFSREGLDIY